MFSRTTRNKEFDAPFNSLQRRARLLFVNAKYNGIANTIMFFVKQISKRLGLYSGPVEKLGQGSSSSGLDVSGIVAVSDLSIPDAKRHSANHYEHTSELEFRHVLDSLKLSLSQYQFLDFGSGKGAVLAAAAGYPFKGVTGVEFCPNLHAVAVRNAGLIKKVKAQFISPLLQDATEYIPPAEPHVFFFYNPFKPDIMKYVLENCRVAVRDSAQRSYIMYKNPVHGRFFEDQPGINRISEPFGGSWAVYTFDAVS